jgi:hypothetical protein
VLRENCGMTGPKHLAFEANVPVRIGFLIRMDLQATSYVANGKRQQLRKRQCEQFDLVTRGKHDLFSKHLKIERHRLLRIVLEVGNANVLIGVQAHT